MRLYNILDEQQRFIEYKVILKETGEQKPSHTYSYLYRRTAYQDLGQTMGLQKITEQ